jgi:hypothetical protein
MLDIYAGPKALQRITNEGFAPELFDTILGASGGPKWFVLAGLDRVIIPEFFANTAHKLHVVGSSAGAFRAACMAQNDPKAAINRLAHYYANTVYNDKPSPFDITQSVYTIMDQLMGQTGVAEILNNERVKVHFIVARAKGLTRFEHKALQIPGLLMSAGMNALSRKKLKHYYDRVVFSTDSITIDCPYGLPSEYLSLTMQNLIQALTASGSIPAIMEGIKNISDAPQGMYRDGGIIDYHFDLSFPHQQSSDSLTLYPHFYPKPITGWFDKSLKKRKPHAKNYDNVVMLVPSAEFVAKLPYGKIPDRTDFETMNASTRIAYWTRVLDETDRLGEEFLSMANDENVTSYIKPLVF